MASGRARPSRPTRQGRNPLSFVALGIIVLAIAWFLGGPAVNDFAATHGHGIEGTFNPTHQECHQSKSGTHCEWHGTFTADDGTIVTDVQMDSNDGSPARGWYAHIVPGVSKDVASGTSSWLAPGIVAVVIVGALVGGTWIAAARRRRRNPSAGSPRRPPVPRVAKDPVSTDPIGITPPAVPTSPPLTPSRPADGSTDIPGLTRY